MKNEIIRITQEQVIEFERIAEEAPHKERNTAQQEMQKIQKGLCTLTGKGYNSEEITEKIQQANIENIKITTVQKALRNIKQQEETKKHKQKETKRGTQRATQQIKTEKPRETPTEIREVKKQTSPQVNQQQQQRIIQRATGITPQEIREQDRHIKLKIEQQRQEKPQEAKTALQMIKKTTSKEEQEQDEQEQDDIAETPFDE